MDASQQLLLPDDSFSCAWLIDLNSSAAATAAAEAVGDSQRSHDGAGSFIEIEPDYFFSIRWSTDDQFDFGLPSPQCSAQVHADQIFSDGHLLPLRHDQPPSAADAPSGPRLAKSQSVNSPPQKTPAGPATKSSSSSSSLLRSKSQKKNTCKYLCFLMPLYKTVKDLRLLSSSSPSFSSSSSSSSSYSSSFKSANTGKDSVRSSPRTSDAMSSVDLCRGINSDISIDDAILHCKKSIGRGK
ncbi:probable membrane-associated kinase regulator 6 [Zingiber officinale]|uniref:probable membrane-associated kinase regulator 6 n=1 Tax=Zingiber officinale TaxID=94328 RepID=UPI001C4B2595|nr:probable membrane-associated kinase regulator 6 [Zingiber officinale]